MRDTTAAAMMSVKLQRGRQTRMRECECACGCTRTCEYVCVCVVLCRKKSMCERERETGCLKDREGAGARARITPWSDDGQHLRDRGQRVGLPGVPRLVNQVQALLDHTRQHTSGQLREGEY